MLIDLTCPAELFRTALPTDDDPCCELLLYNLSDRIIVSVEVTLRLLDNRDEDAEHLVYRARALNGRPASTFPMRIPCTPNAAIHRADVTIEKVWFSDNAVWRRDSSKEVSYTPNHLPVSRGLTNLKYVAGESATGYPSQQEGLWVCVCGRPNADEEQYCARCRRDKKLIFSRYNREAVEKQLSQKERQLELQSRSAREDTARMQRIREEAYQIRKLKTSRRVHLATAMVTALILGAAALFGCAPAVRLFTARNMLEEGRLEEARGMLESLGAFPGAGALKADAEYRIAEKTAQVSDDADALKNAAEALRADGREGAKELAWQADFRRAQLLLDAGDWAGSREAAKGLPNSTTGLRDLQQETDYLEAVENMELRYYVLARNAFLKLGAYKDSASLADACIYLPALAQMENGEYDAARTQLERIPDYENSRSLMLQCSYLKGLTLEQKEDLAGAADAYFAAGDYEDAAEKAAELTYVLAEDAFTAASFEKAAELYQKIPGYLDSDEKALASIYTLARRAISDLEYNRALSLLGQLPSEYEDVVTLTRQVHYAMGLDAQKEKDWPAAAEHYAAAAGYRDAGRRLERAVSNLTEEEAAPYLAAKETPEPTPEPATAPVETPAAEPTAEPSDTPAAEPTAEPVMIPVAEPVATPANEPTATPMATAEDEPTAKPAATAEPAPSEKNTETAAPESTGVSEAADGYLVQDEE